MAPRGMKPKAPGEARFRGPRMHGWVEVDDAPFCGGPALPPRRRDGSPWPGWIREHWEAWRSMPHARLWGEADWQFALDSIEVAAAAFTEGAKVGLLTELRYREKIMGTTWSSRQDMRIRYVEAVSAAPAPVTRLDDFRDL